MRNLLRSSGLFLALACISGQWTSAQDHFDCATDRVRVRDIAADPHLLQREADMEAFVQQWISEHEGVREEDTLVYTIPVVFHVIHMNGPENISNEQIFDEMEVLNRDYRKLNADVNSVCCGFQDIAADIRLQFKLATIDPTGNCTNGIERLRSVETFVGDDGSKLHLWPRNHYLNVWTVAKMEEGTAGYSRYPSAVEGPLAIADGVILLHNYVGRLGTGSDYNSRALTHEVGHWLDLKHVWGDNNGEEDAPDDHMSPDCGDDAVEDTPWTRGWNTCPTPAQSRDCNDTIYENFENYMEYSYCSKMFTEGQRARIRAALTGGLAERNQLFAQQNLANCGVNGVTDQVCAPVADFYCFNDGVAGLNTPVTPQGTRFYCIGDDVQFFDNSTHGTVTSWQWTFQDGNPATSTERNPEVSFTSGGGWKSVSLTVSNDQGSSSRTDDYSVFISDPWPFLVGAVNENFEAPCSDCPYVWENYENNASQWQRVTNAGHSGTGSMRMNGFDTYGSNDYFIDDGANDIDALVTPTMDLTWLHNGELTFWYAYTTKTTDLPTATEKLEVWSSTTCGRTWQFRETLTGADLITDGASSNSYVPEVASAWRQATIDLPGTLAADQVRFKFIYYSSAASNNLYIDDININGTVGLGELGELETGLSLAPNPTNGELNVTYTLPGSGNGSLTMEDAQGRTVWSRATRNLAQERVSIDTRALGLAPGVYLMRLVHDRGQRTERLVIR